MASSFTDADTISISPSLSKSDANTERALSADVATSLADQDGSAAPLFIYIAMVLSSMDAETISISPSLSKSDTVT